MIVFLYGRDGYRLKQNLEKIVEEYKKKHASGMSFSVLDFDDAPAGEIIEKLTDLIKTNTFFNEKRLVVLKNSFSGGDMVAGLIKTWGLAADKQRIFVFLENFSEEELTKKDKKLFALLTAKPNVVKMFEPLDARELEKWAKKEIEAAGLEIEPIALKKLVSSVCAPGDRKNESDSAATWQLKQEIDKLADHSFYSKTKTIKAADIDLLVPREADLNIFDVIDAFAARSKPRAIALLYHHLESGMDPYYIFSMLVYQFRNLLKVKGLAKNAIPYANIIKKTGLHPFVAQKTYAQCDRFDLDELKRFFSRLAQIEIDAKYGKIDMEDGLYNFVFSLTP